jgi:hypothetical protein
MTLIMFDIVSSKNTRDQSNYIRAPLCSESQSMTITSTVLDLDGAFYSSSSLYLCASEAGISSTSVSVRRFPFSSTKSFLMVRVRVPSLFHLLLSVSVIFGQCFVFVTLGPPSYLCFTGVPHTFLTGFWLTGGPDGSFFFFSTVGSFSVSS